MKSTKTSLQGWVRPQILCIRRLGKLEHPRNLTLPYLFTRYQNMFENRSAPSLILFALAGWMLTFGIGSANGQQPDAGEAKAPDESRFLSKTRQLTFDGVRAGEGYFSRDGKLMVFQSERDKDNPFYQIYLMDRETGDIERVSPGVGKTTCAWIHPDGDRVLFATTQFDPEAKAKQKAEIEQRASGNQKRYAWDYDENFDLVEWNRKTHETRNSRMFVDTMQRPPILPMESTSPFPPIEWLTSPR